VTAGATADLHNHQQEPPPRRVWKSILASMLILSGVYACRGWILAWLVGGHYAWPTLIVDCAALALLILALRLLDLGVKKVVYGCIGTQTRTRKIVAATASGCICFALVAPFVIALVQFHPQKIGCGTTPAESGLSYTGVTLESDGRRLSAWHIPASAVDRPVVVICHGMGANKQNFLVAAYTVHSLDYNVLIFDFRGHGDSDGRTITFGVKESADVKAAFDFVRAKHPSSKIYGLGYSMGASALLKMAAEHGGFDKIVLDSTFARAENVALYSLLWYFGPVKWPMWQVGRFWGWVFSGVDVGRHNPEEYLAKVSDRPILLIHGAADSMIPSTESVRLHEVAGENGQLWIVEGMGHLQALQQPAYRDRLRQFFETESVP
jgi:pimeloyl-ACP methyl ester carboxylesterase